MERMKQSTILPVTSPNVHQFKKNSFTSRLNDKLQIYTKSDSEKGLKIS